MTKTVMGDRRKVRIKDQTDVLNKSRRRCCICFGLHDDGDLKKGQIAHLDGDPSNNDPDNLAFLCFDHHDEYDGKTSQAKGLTIEEVKRYREELYNRVLPCPARVSKSAEVTLRPLRLDARNDLLAFVDLCITYRTLHSERIPGRTRDLTSALRHLQERIEALGPLSMPEFDELYAEVRENAWNLQRLLDRQRETESRSIEPEYATLDDKIDGIEDWFAQIRDRIKVVLDPYLTL